MFLFSSEIPRLNDYPLSTASNYTEKKNLIRQRIRTHRRALSRLQQKTAATNLKRNHVLNNHLIRSKHIALYLSNDGEISPDIIMTSLFKGKKHVYLPVMHPLKKNMIVFCRMRQQAKLKINRFGIREPDFKSVNSLQPRLLSLVLFPLVAFDVSGNRMGMGGGFYDRAFAFKIKNQHLGPALIGLAHDFQKQKELPIEKWDIPLEGVATDKKFYRETERVSID